MRMTFAALAAGHGIGLVPLSWIIVPVLVGVMVVLGQSLIARSKSHA